MWLSTIVATRNAFKPFRIQLRTVSSALTMRKQFTVWSPEQEEQKGDGLCCKLQKQKAFADSLRNGILCIGLACSLDTTDTLAWSAHGPHLDAGSFKKPTLCRIFICFLTVSFGMCLLIALLNCLEDYLLTVVLSKQ